MKLVILFVLFPYVISTAYRQNGYKYFEVKPKHNYDYQTQSVPESVSIIVKSWLATDTTLRKLSEKFVQTVLPYAFTLLATSDLTPDCAKDVVNFLRGIAETKRWAFQMLDSYGKLPTGIMKGTVSSLGDYKSCLNVSASNLFIGKYCLLDVEIPLPEQRNFHHWKQDFIKAFDLTQNDTIVNEFLRLEEKLYMLHPRTSICIPSTCTIEDIQHLVKKAIQLTGLQFNTNIKSCETLQDDVEVTFLDLILTLVLLSLILVVMVATTIDFFQRITSDVSQREAGCLLSFSFFFNAEKLVKKDENPDSIRIFHGMRVITMAWLILTHVSLVDHVEAYGGLKRYFQISSSFWGQIFSGGLLGVETFFFMSGTLLSYNIVKATEQKISIGMVFLNRYLRTTIPHVLMIAVTCLLPFVSSGPLYKEIIGSEAENCRERGWMNLLYINNFLPFSEICMGNTWYLSVDIQLFLVAILILIPFRNNPRVAIVCIVAMLFSGILGTLVSHVTYNLPPTMLAIDPGMEYMNDLFPKSYFMPHFHLPTYCIGLLVGYFLALRKSVRVSMKVNILLWTAALSTQFFVVFFTFVWSKGTEFPGLLPSVLYGCTHRVLWSLSLAWITVACQSNHGGIIAKFLGSERFVLLSRLTFMAYLTNFTVKYWFIGTASDVIVYNLNVLINTFMSILAVTFLASFVLTLLFETPFMNLDKMLKRRLSERKTGKRKW